MDARYTEEVFNVLLCQLLSERDLVAVPEVVVKSRGEKRIPDIIIYLRGLRLLVEGKVEDTPNAATNVLQDIRHKVGTLGIGNLGIAVLYPTYLRDSGTYSIDTLKQHMASCHFRFILQSECEDNDWHTGTVNDIRNILLRTYDHIIRQDIVERSVQILEEAMADLASAFSLSPGTRGRLGSLLGIRRTLS